MIATTIFPELHLNFSGLQYISTRCFPRLCSATPAPPPPEHNGDGHCAHAQQCPSDVLRCAWWAWGGGIKYGVVVARAASVKKKKIQCGMPTASCQTGQLCHRLPIPLEANLQTTRWGKAPHFAGRVHHVLAHLLHVRHGLREHVWVVARRPRHQETASVG